MKIGAYRVSVVDAGRFRLDGGAMFGVVPKVLWEKKKPADEQNRIRMATNLLLLRGEGRTILVDTGIGEKFDPKFQNIYAVDYSQHNLKNGLEKQGLTPEDITHVIVTHLHFDHCGGNTMRDEQGNILPTFPNATYYVQRDQLRWAGERNEKDRASYFPENYQPLIDSGQMTVLEGEQELFPGIDLLVVNGHTPGQQLVLLRGNGERVLFAADLIPTHAHIPVPWVMAYDLYPLHTIAEKKRILKQAADENWLLIFEHDPEVVCATVAATEKGYGIGERVNLAE